MYTYGPFDSEVLSDVDYAARLDALSVEMERHVNGYAYLIRPGKAIDGIMYREKQFLDRYGREIQWTIDNFAASSAGPLEMLSTIIYVNSKLEVSSNDDLSRVVKEMKPRFSEETIRASVDELQEMGVLV